MLWAMLISQMWTNLRKTNYHGWLITDGEKIYYE